MIIYLIFSLVEIQNPSIDYPEIICLCRSEDMVNNVFSLMHCTTGWPLVLNKLDNPTASS
ncbi:hypothetical protein H5410_017392 [Solanum commersonii]|uniref:Uncharacterized protein n=1 Tax=Solanum commersonii TaxID=4109 RepID=A0A9J5ZZB2_SOLCO|nr:hypothetical protein H5410_017392 [Solanum commersonii]